LGKEKSFSEGCGRERKKTRGGKRTALGEAFRQKGLHTIPASLKH